VKWLNTSKKEFIPFSKITHISYKTQEEILPKHLNLFLKTTIAQLKKSISPNTQIFLSFIKETNLYEIYLFETSSNHTILEFQLFEKLAIDLKTHNNYLLFITNSFFVVYQQEKAIFAYENKYYTQKEIVEFIKFTHKIKIDYIKNIEQNELEELSLEFENLSQLPTLKLNSSKEYIYYFIYLLLLILSTTFLYLRTPNQVSNHPVILENKNISEETERVITNIVTLKIELLSFNYIGKGFLTLKTTPDKLHQFTLLCKKSKITKLEKIDENLFFVEIEIEF